MATQRSQALGRLAVAPSTLVLFIWMIVPLGLTIYFSTLRYNLLYPERSGFIGLTNYTYSSPTPPSPPRSGTTLSLSGRLLVITIVLGVLLALLLDKPIYGQGIVRLMVIAPLLHHAHRLGAGLEDLLMNPVSGFSPGSPGCSASRRSTGSGRFRCFR
jgi:sorbitol/mannitol transport system permease protein